MEHWQFLFQRSSLRLDQLRVFLSVDVVYKLRREELLYLLSSPSQISKDTSSIRLDKYCVNFSVFILIRITFRTHVRALLVPDRGAVSFFTSSSISGHPLLNGNGFLFPFLKSPHPVELSCFSRVVAGRRIMGLAPVFVLDGISPDKLKRTP